MPHHPKYSSRRTLCLRSFVWLATLCLLATPSPAWPQAGSQHDLAAQVYDLVIQRPIGLAETTVGLGITAVMLPIAYPARRSQQLIRHCVGEPVEYTFRRKLGDFGQPPEDHCGAVGASWSVVGMAFGILERPLGILFGRSPFSRSAPKDQAEV
ncbi:hypothetical protein MK280_19920 [Myxococcota bacterium]|nr:hypothetical protein [Myxococcota bacterium]